MPWGIASESGATSVLSNADRTVEITADGTATFDWQVQIGGTISHLRADGGQWYMEMEVLLQQGASASGISRSFRVYNTSSGSNTIDPTIDFSSLADGDVLGVAVDLTTDSTEFFINGVSQGSQAMDTELGAVWELRLNVGDSSATAAEVVFRETGNFVAPDLSFSLPSGFLPWEGPPPPPPFSDFWTDFIGTREF